jgi:glycosyltransferase involved in cell wall biosynthesis
MKILYISPENTVGTLELYQRIHEQHGNTVRYVTFFHSPKGFREDICLNLPFNFTRPCLKHLRHKVYQMYRGKAGYHKEKDGYPPVWQPEGRLDAAFLAWKEKHWDPRIRAAIDNYGLKDFDIIHFESGMDFYKDARFAAEAKSQGAGIVCHYHGEDLRTRGVLKPLDALSDLNLTNELDLMQKHPDIHYLFLPFDLEAFRAKYRAGGKGEKPLLVTHAPTNRYYKGSDIIIPLCRELEKADLIRFRLIENLPHAEAMELKRHSDIFIDQIGERGGWGYGMNSLESLALGICTMTEMNETYENFIPDHPFVNIHAANLRERLLQVISDDTLRREKGDAGPHWIKKYHDLTAVGETLYAYYSIAGI